jgi:esterase/lipase superfamily enzyme
LAGQFPQVGETENKKQKHVSFFIHGYNYSCTEAVTRHRKLQKQLYADHSGTGEFPLFLGLSK